MKMVELKNVSIARISVAQVRGLALNCGETVKVTPATLMHPAVDKYVKSGAFKVMGNIDKDVTKEEPKAPAPPKPVAPTPAPTVSEPEATAEEAPQADEVTDEATGMNLRETYVSAPGITDSNVDAVLEAFPTQKELATASTDALVEAGVSKSYTKKLRKWASSAE